VFVRSGARLVAAQRSKMFPAIDLGLVARCVAAANQPAAVKMLRTALARR
jgi:hypothetical protein